jgi:hypothetical protein
MLRDVPCKLANDLQISLLFTKAESRKVKTLRTLTIILMTLVLSMASAAAEKDPPNVQSLMTPEDYAASGLNKLSDAERAHLSEWVERYREGAVIGPVVHKKQSQMTEEEKIEDKKEREAVIEAKVLPAFTGWTGKTIFRLDNGQIWQQRQPGKMLYDGGDSTVTITRNVMGKYILKHGDSGRAVGVQRIN